jgi:hypothetical protein
VEQGCTSKYARLVDELVTDTLPPATMREILGHVASCPECQKRYNFVVLASRILDSGLGSVEFPVDGKLSWVEPGVVNRPRLVPVDADAELPPEPRHERNRPC